MPSRFSRRAAEEPDPNQREQAVVWLAQSYIESNQGGKVVELLPDMLTKAPRARLSIEFNLALLNGGDKMFAAQQESSRPLLQSGASSGAFLEANQKYEAELERRRDQVRKSGQQLELVVDINRRIQDLGERTHPT